MASRKRKAWGNSERAMRRRIMQDDLDVWQQNMHTNVSDPELPLTNNFPGSQSVSDLNSIWVSPEDNLPVDVNMIQPVEANVEWGNDLWFDAEDCGLLIHDCDECADCVCVACDGCIHMDGPDGCVHCEKCVPDILSVESDSESQSESEGTQSNDDGTDKLCHEFKNLALSLKLNHQQISGLLLFFRKHHFGSFPKCARTLLHTPSDLVFKEVEPGLYCTEKNT
ncbi:hypothetical protein KUF71_003630 [Frankliniella fusca]|uniref:Uncharacterized protein n=1 Tax=Frankliniella fusca TaxID=407009 RepID=A0AAE1HYB3_9NEOP|nr:hypothetical protein KUF71_003630 [Frankliniella fusca]